MGISLKAGAKKSREPLYNTYVGTQYDKRGWSKDKLAKALSQTVSELSKRPKIEHKVVLYQTPEDDLE